MNVNELRLQESKQSFIYQKIKNILLLTKIEKKHPLTIKKRLLLHIKNNHPHTYTPKTCSTAYILALWWPPAGDLLVTAAGERSTLQKPRSPTIQHV